MYPFHLQARKVCGHYSDLSSPLFTRSFQLNIWTMGFLLSPFLSPFVFGFMVARARCVASLCPSTHIAKIPSQLALGLRYWFNIWSHCASTHRPLWERNVWDPNNFSLLILHWDHFSRMYDRRQSPPRSPAKAKSGSKFQRRMENLFGITGFHLAKYRPTWAEVSRIWIQLTWRPHVFGILFFEVCHLEEEFS
jgi:hypothetical protein